MIGQLIGGAIGLGQTILNNGLGQAFDTFARQQNYEYGEQSANNADKRTRALYEDYYSPAALLRQYKEAGLSPSLMFANGAGGAGGMTQGAQGSGAAGLAPTSYGANLIEGAQLDVARAQARKLNAEADTEEGKNDRGKAEIKQLLWAANNEELKFAYNQYDTALKQVELTNEASLSEWKIKNFVQQTEYLAEITRSAKVKAEIDEASEKDVIKYLKERAENLAADTLLKKANTALANAHIELTETQVKDLISQITTREGALELDKSKLEEQVKQWATENGLTTRGQNIEIAKVVTSGLADLTKVLAVIAKLKG